MLSLFVIAGLAKANDHFNRPWQLSIFYVVLILFANFMFDLNATIKIFAVYAAITFVLIGLFLKVLYNFQHTIFTWLFLLFAGIFVISILTKVLMGVWVAI